MTSEKDNIIRWDFSKKPFYENFFFELRDPEKRFAFLGRYTLTSEKEAPVGSVWGVFFDLRGLKNTVLQNDFPLHKVMREQDFFFLQIGGSAIFHNGCRASLKEKGQEMEWDLSWEPCEEGFLPLPRLLYSLPFPRTKILTPNPLLRFNGRLRLGNETFTLSNAVGQQSHAWGNEPHPSYLWGFANQFDNNEALFEIAATPAPLQRKEAPLLTAMVLRIGHEDYRFNLPHHWLKNKNNIAPDHWHFEAKNRKFYLVGDLEAEENSFARLPYQTADRKEQAEFKTLQARLHLQLFKKEEGVWTKTRELTSSQASLEYDR
ncbi:MAG: hypothetical protein HYS22_04130 [Deltaproteobacteria bacterium]|nr:hypothetical protein [Deltaproteobacteria bacterium]